MENHKNIEIHKQMSEYHIQLERRVAYIEAQLHIWGVEGLNDGSFNELPISIPWERKKD